MSYPSPPDTGPPRRRPRLVVATATGVALGVATVAVATVLASRSSDEPASGAPDEADLGGGTGACPPGPTVTVESSTVAPLTDPNPAGFFVVQVSGTIVNDGETPVIASVEVPLTVDRYAPLRSESIEVGADATVPFEAEYVHGLLPGTTIEPDLAAADLAWRFVDADLAHCSRQHGATG